jgi:16S rRNA U1498 N3-methylase RsmE
LKGKVVYCRPGGAWDPGAVDVVAIGPEGGFSDDELPEDARLWDLGPTVLRVETAALVAAARLTSL